MPSYLVRTGERRYQALVERGALAKLGEVIPPRSGKLFVLTTADVWALHGARVESSLGGRPFQLLYFPGGEENKRLAVLETLAEKMVAAGADRSSLLVVFGGGIVTDVGGFLAAVFMRGIPVVSAPTTLLAQVDAGVGGKTGVNLVAGKNLVGAFHQPSAVLIDPDVLKTLPEREYRAGLYEVLKCGIIRSPGLHGLMAERADAILAQAEDLLETIIAESVRIKAEVVSADERESGLRRILNFGHTIGHALEAETGYTRFLHGEAVGFGMRAAIHLAHLTGLLAAEDAVDMLDAIARYGPLPPLDGIDAVRLVNRLRSDKKTIQGSVHFVLPERVGSVKVVSGVDEQTVVAAIRAALP